MAPATTIGAASPVGSQGEDLGTTMEAKLKNETAATVRALTLRRGAAAQALAEDTSGMRRRSLPMRHWRRG